MVSSVRPAALQQPWMVAAVAIALLFLRMPERLIDGFLWAEDGRIFLHDAYAAGTASLLWPYAQYLHLLPRLIAWSVSKLCYIDQVARPLAWICALATGAGCACLFAFARRRFSLPAAWAFALTPLLIPHGGEVWLTITNLQWVTAPVLLVLLWDAFCSPASAPRQPGTAAVRDTAIVVLTLTGPFGLLFSPLAVAGLAATRRVPRSRRAWIAIAAYAVAAGAQLATILGNPAPPLPAGMAARPPLGVWLHYPWKGQFLHYMVLEFVLPFAWTDALGEAWKIAAVAVALPFAACLSLAGQTHRLAAAGLFALAAGLWIIGVIRVGIPDLDIKWHPGGRYLYIPFIAMAWSLLIIRETTPRPGAKALAGCLLSMVLLNSLLNFHAIVWQDHGLVYSHDTATWLLRLPPSADWSIPVRPAWTSPPQPP